MEGIKQALGRKGMPWRELARTNHPHLALPSATRQGTHGSRRPADRYRRLRRLRARIASQPHRIARTINTVKRLLMGIPKRL